jgi:hypothetical protein
MHMHMAMTSRVLKEEIIERSIQHSKLLPQNGGGLMLISASGVFFRRVCVSAIALVFVAVAGGQDVSHAIRPGDVWLDDRGLPIQAHGGGILRMNETYYWFGEDRSPGNAPDMRYVACYSSTDLAHWRFRGQVLALKNPEGLGDKIVVERPKVFFNRKTKTFVMYMHLDAPGANGSAYKLARVAVATSKTVDGTYTYLRSFRPLDQESRDIGQFVDDDGSAYLIFESRPTKGFFIAKLSDDYLDVVKEVSFVAAPLEGGAIVHYKGLYYVLGSHLSGWSPNPNVYATARTLEGPWSEFKDLAPRETKTYSSQSTMLLKVEGTKATTVIYVGDRWKPKELSDSRYVWMPLKIADGEMVLPEPRPWTLDVHTGEAHILDEK